VLLRDKLSVVSYSCTYGDRGKTTRVGVALDHYKIPYKFFRTQVYHN